MQLSYDEIRKIHRAEKNSTKLAEVEPDFYNDLNSFIKKEKRSYLNSLKDFSVNKAKDFTNLKRMIEEIYSLREKKIVGKALITSRTKEVSEENMALPEKKLYYNILSLLENHNTLLKSLFLTEKKAKIAKDLNTTTVKIITGIPPFVGTDMKEYGPYNKGEVVSLPYKIAKLLDSRKLGKIEGRGK